jgi:hypothetical protein
VQSLASYLYSGVTTVYDAGNDASFILTLRAEEARGQNPVAARVRDRQPRHLSGQPRFGIGDRD